jgi:sterol desaturase/sphingolipid hydroxylase (fatty acid hydroxylase superfamily)
MLGFQSFPIEYDIVVYAIPFFILLIAIEVYLSIKMHKDSYIFIDAASSIGMGLGSVFINILMKAVAFTFYLFLYKYRLFDLGWHWWVFVLLFFADDFTFYWHHRLSHEIRLLWSCHVNHHSSVKYTLATALRQSWGEQFYKYIWWAWLPLLGFHPIQILMMMSISLVYQFWIHTELIHKLPSIIEFVFNTPSHHRVHHASNVRYLDKNHAGILIIWDRIFGTFAEELDTEKPIYGITTNIQTYNLFKIASHEFVAILHDVKSAPNWKDKIKYLVYPPGWSHNGKDLRAKTLRKAIGLK